MSRSTSQTGAALVIVLLAVAVLTFLAVTVSDHLRFTAKRMGNQRAAQQAFWYAVGGEQLAIRTLRATAKDKTTHFGQPWATQGVTFPIDGGLIAAAIEDGHACFNLNNLGRTANSEINVDDPTQRNDRERWFFRVAANLDIDEDRAELIRQRIQDWTDADTQPQGSYGAEDLFYGDREVSYQVPNDALLSKEELLLMVEFEEGEAEKIRDHFCILPTAPTLLNVNTVPPNRAAILAAALGDEVDELSVKNALEARPKEGWATVDEFLAEPDLARFELASSALPLLGVKSTFFKASVSVSHYQAQLQLDTMLQVSQQRVQVVGREYGELF